MYILVGDKSAANKNLHMNDNKITNKSSDAVYGLGVVGSLVYYISTATSFWMGMLGVLKALVWPAFLVYELLQFLHR
jgi:hypothetical protein